MSTQRIDDILAKKAENEMAERIGAANKAFSELVSATKRDYPRVDYHQVVAMLLNEILTDSYRRDRVQSDMEKDRESPKTKKLITNAIQQRLANDLLERLDTIGDDVEELRNDLNWHGHHD